MNLVIRYVGIGIEGYPLAHLKNVLNGSDAVKVKMEAKGMIMLSDKKIIKCVKDYYRTPEGLIASKKNISNQCYYIQTELHIRGVNNYKCVECHLKCINMSELKQIFVR